MSEVHKVLDHGYVKLIESWGSDERIIESARMSTAKGFQGWGGPCPDHPHDAECRCKGTGQLVGDEKLLRFLWEKKHTTPFEMAGITIEVKAPIFIFREWHRHRTQSYSEMSSRYVPLPNEDYVPEVERILQIGSGTRQAKAADGALELTADNARRWQAALKEHYKSTQELYELGLHVGIPKELARLPLPVARYSAMRASANLLNWFRFMGLRLPENAQWEIRAYAGAVAEIISDCFPRSSSLFGESLLK